MLTTILTRRPGFVAALLLLSLCGPLARAAGFELPAQTLQIGDSLLLRSAVLKEPRRINVYLPEAYAQNPQARWPVLYMPDGGMAEDFLHIAGLLQVSIANGTMRPFILVGIENTERRRDLTGPTEQAEDRAIAPRVGGSAAFRRFIREELMPAVQQRYRTTAETAVIGESLAGLFVVETWVLEPQLFNSYIAVDPSLWWDRESLTAVAAKRLKAETSKPKLFIANSSEPSIKPTVDRFAGLLAQGQAAGAAADWHRLDLPLETHQSVYHPAAVQALRQLFKPAQAH